ncbi:MAG: hypothetical protein ACE5E4_02815 [Candidatus Binatia bacterium]
MMTFLTRLYVALCFTVGVAVVPTLAQEAPELPEPLEFEGLVAPPVRYVCDRDHRFWCGRLAGTVSVWNENGEQVSRWLKPRTPVFLNGISVGFSQIRTGDKAKLYYFEGSSFAALLELERNE